MTRSIFAAHPHAVTLDPQPIAAAGILAGTPVGSAKVLLKTQDKTSHLVVWECTAGEFVWDYAEDETAIVISGEAVVTGSDGEDLSLSPGSVVFFPAGSSSLWRIPDRIKKVAILRKDLPPAVGIGVRAWHKFLRVTRLRRISSLS